MDRPVPFHVPKPFPVRVDKPVPYKVIKKVPYAVPVPGDCLCFFLIEINESILFQTKT